MLIIESIESSNDAGPVNMAAAKINNPMFIKKAITAAIKKALFNLENISLTY